MATTIQRLMDWREDRPCGDLLDPETVAMIEEYWTREDASYAAIADEVGLEIEVVRMVIDEGETGTSYIPTPEEIIAECEAIRSEWTPQESRERQTAKQVPWRVPVTHLEIGGDDG